jgi:3-oxoacyl-(acyl-carrier-protein) synthase
MAINTPLGDTLPGFLDGLLQGRSALSRWRAVDTSRIYCKVGADLSGYDIPAAVAAFEGRAPDDVARRLRRLVMKAPWSTRLTMVMALEAALDARLLDGAVELVNVGAIVAGHNINLHYQYESRLAFEDEPDFIDSMLSLHGLDTDHVGRVSEVLGVRGPIYTVGAACASANTALRCAIDEIRHHDLDAVVVTGAVLEFSPIELHAMALMGAISFESFNDEPARASRPYDVRREGFVPAHGGGALVVESLESARRRGARIHAEILGIEASADANHLPQPSEDGQVRAMLKALRHSGVEPQQIDYVNAHATSTPLGDLTELRSIKRVFGEHAHRLRINATKSMLGHTCWAAPIVETVAAVLQMNASRLHGSINIDELDPEVDLDVCAKGPVDAEIRHVMKNSFGFGGINCVSVLKRFED